MSQSKMPLLYQVIPLIDTLTLTLETASDNKALFPAVHAATAKGIAILNKYYAKMDESIMYHCTMSRFIMLVSSSMMSLNYF
jgi:hypothetical protein